MPTYQYRCTECGHDLEAVQKFTDAALTECPSCQGQLRKIYNAVGVVFKGSGFYRTDSRQSPSGNGSSDADSGSAKTGSKETAGSGAKDNGTGSGGGKATAKEPAGSSPASGSGSSTGAKAAAS